MSAILMSAEELVELTDQRQARRQYEVLRARGFWRVQLTHGRVILERAHYLAVCAGALAPGTPSSQQREQRPIPKIQPYVPASRWGNQR
jgi:hypothetical protein